MIADTIRRGLRLFICTALAAWIGSVGCGEPKKHNKSAGQTESSASFKKKPTDPVLRKPVAKVGDRVITIGDVTDALNRKNPYVRMRYASLQRKKEFVDNLVRLEILSAEAKRRGLDRDPEVLRRVKRVMVNRLMERLHKELVKFSDITDADAKAYYDKNTILYRQPAKVRMSQIVLKTEAEARRVLAAAKSKPGNMRHFAELVNKHSIDAASKVRRGDLDFFAADDKKLPAPLIKAAFAINGMWKLGGPVKTEGGWVVLLKTGDRGAINRPFSLEKERIKNRIFNERRFRAVNAFIKKLQAKAKVEIFEKNLGKVKVSFKGLKAKKGGAHVHR